MRSAERPRRVLCFLLCLTICVGIAIATAASTQLHTQAALPEVLQTQTVRVGLCVANKNNTLLISTITSEKGFSVGYSKGRSMTTLFNVTDTEFAVLPDKNANLRGSGTLLTGSSSDTGNYKAYNIALKTVYGSYTEARSVANGYSDGFVAYTDAGYEVRYGAFTTEAEAALSIGSDTKNKKVAIPAAGGITILNRQTKKIFFEYEGSYPLAIKERKDNPVTVQISKTQTYSYRGFFEYTAARKLSVINVVDLETYVKCVMANEIGTNQSRETRKAFSVLVRTVPLNSKHKAYGYDVCSSNCCQIYYGNYRRDAVNDALVDSTKGEYITYEGAPITCLYHNSNGGVSCSSYAAWGHEVPYLTSVTLSNASMENVAVWNFTLSEQELTERLLAQEEFRALSDHTVKKVSIEATDPFGSGYVTHLAVTDERGCTVEIRNSEEVRSALGFRSANFTLEYTASAKTVGTDGKVTSGKSRGYIDSDGVYHEFDCFEELPIAGSKTTLSVNEISIDGIGAGHGVGFSAPGSEQLVKEGYSYKYVIRFFFPGTEIKKIS